MLTINVFLFSQLYVDSVISKYIYIIQSSIENESRNFKIKSICEKKKETGKKVHQIKSTRA